MPALRRSKRTAGPTRRPTEEVRWKTALVTGASSGIGAAIAVKLGSLGMEVALCARRRDRLAAVARRVCEAGGRAEVIAADLTKDGEPERVISETVKALGRLDVLVNNAGIGKYGGSLDATDDAFWEQFRLNVWAPFALVRAAAPVISRQGGGQIVNIGSVVGYVGTTRAIVYNATKWALRGFNESWREELYRKRIKVAYVAPGFVITEFGQRKPGENESSKEWAMMPEDVAHHVAAIVTQAPNSDVKEIVVQVLDRS